MSSQIIKESAPQIFTKIIRNLLGIVRAKVLAILNGPIGIGILGQFLSYFNFQSKILTFGTSASFVVTYNEAKSKGNGVNDTILANAIILLSAGAITILLTLLFAEEISAYIFSDDKYVTLIYLSSILYLIFTINLLHELYLQASKQFNLLAKGRTIGIVFGLAVIYHLISYFGLTGIVLDLIVVNTVSLIYYQTLPASTLVELRSVFQYDSIKRFNKIVFKSVFGIAAKDLIRNLAVFGSLILVRLLIVNFFSIETAGYYHSLFSITNYINIILEGFMVYYFAQMSSLTDTQSIKHELNLSFSLLLSIVFFYVALLVIFPEVTLYLLFSEKFVPYSGYLGILAISKVLYFYSFFFTTTLLARRRVNEFLIIEIVRNIILILFSYMASRDNSFSGLIFAIVFADLGGFIVSNIFVWKSKIEFLYRKNIIIYSIVLIQYFVVELTPMPVIVKNISIGLTGALLGFIYLKQFLNRVKE